MRHVDERPLWASKVDDLFFSDDDGEHGAAVACRFANDGSEPLRLFWRETEYETLAPGAVADYETSIGSQWSFRALDGAVVRRAVVDVAGTSRQRRNLRLGETTPVSADGCGVGLSVSSSPRS